MVKYDTVRIDVGRGLIPYLGIVYLKSWGMRKIGLGGLYVKLSAQVFGVSQTWKRFFARPRVTQGSANVMCR